MKMVIKRTRADKTGTMGFVYLNDKHYYMSMENPWAMNKPKESCIPEGIYTCEIVHSPKFGTAYEVKNVPGRSHILFHAGNTEKDTDGCILLGLTSDPSKMFVGNSKAAIADFHARAEGKPFELEIINEASYLVD